MPKVKSYSTITPTPTFEVISHEGDNVMLRMQLPHSLMQEIVKFQTKMHLYHSVGAIRYLLHKALMWEEALQNNRTKM